MGAVLNYSDLSDLRRFQRKEHYVRSARSRTKMPSNKVIAVDFTDLLGDEVSVRIVGRDVYMHGARSHIPK